MKIIKRIEIRGKLMRKMRDIGIMLLVIATSFQVAARQLVTSEVAVNSGSLSPQERQSIDLIHESKNTVRIKFVVIDPLVFDEDEIIAPAAKGKVAKIRKGNSEYGEDGYFYWVGKVESGGEADFLLSSEKGVSGAIRTPDGIISIRPFNKKFHLLVEVDPTLVPMHSKKYPNGAQIDRHHSSEIDTQTDAPEEGAKAPEATAASASSTLDKPDISLLIVFTKGAKFSLNDPFLAVSRTLRNLNDSFGSDVNLHASLAGYYDISFEYLDETSALNSLVLMNDVKQKRDELKADAVILIAKFKEPVTVCGVAREIGATPFTAFAVVDASCLDQYALSHELGHLVGARHNYEIDRDNTPYPYGHGAWAQIPANSTYYCRHDIMSYPVATFRTAVACLNDYKLNVWSSPTPLGDAIDGTRVSFTLGDSSRSNAKLVLNTNGKNVAKFGDTLISSGLNYFIGVLSNIILMITSE